MMSILTISGANLFYESIGSGPLLLLIPGAAGAGEVFHPLAHLLSAHYQVVTYVRRGFSHSLLTGPQDYSHRLATDVDDVRHLLEHLTDQPAIVFGNSSGALVALEVICQYPKWVRTLVAHEPPAATLLPDAEQWLSFFDSVYSTYRADGIPKAMRQFAHGVLGSGDQQVMEQARQKHATKNLLSNTIYWMEHELRQYPRVELDLAVLTLYAERIVLAGGHDSQNQMTYRPNTILASALGREIVDFPGGHLGFLSHPGEFATAFTRILGGYF